jgi:hippurate hydrolase
MEEDKMFTRFRIARIILTTKFKLDLENIFKMRRELHKYPEVRFTEVETKKRLINFLTSRCNIDPNKISTYAETGFTYDIKGTGAAKGKDFAIGFRADMDALPIKEESTFEYASANPGVSHMCGHDGHMVTLLGLANVLTNFQTHIPSNKTIRLVFQPGEEGGHGGRIMVEEGALEGVDEVYALHSWSLPFGKFGIKKSGAMTAGMVRFRVNVQGVGSHGAYPENGKDPITAICQIHSMMHTILSRGIGRKDMAVCTVGEIHAGDTENVIPDFATMGGSIRTEKKEVEEEVKRQLESIVEHISTAMGCKGEVKYIRITPSVINHEVQANALRGAVKEIMGEDSLTEDGMNAS